MRAESFSDVEELVTHLLQSELLDELDYETLEDALANSPPSVLASAIRSSRLSSDERRILADGIALQVSRNIDYQAEPQRIRSADVVESFAPLLASVTELREALPTHLQTMLLGGSRLERELLAAFADQEPRLASCVAQLVATQHTYSGAGTFTSFAPTAAKAELPDGPIGFDGLIEVPGIESGLLASVSVAAGQIEFLEIVAVVGDWNGSASQFALIRSANTA